MRNNTIFISIRTLVLLACIGAAEAVRAAEELVLGVEPLFNARQARQQFQPLCQYLALAAKRTCRVDSRETYFSYWEAIRQGRAFNLFLDDAHFTDYRAQKLGYVVLAKIPNTVTYSLIVQDSNTIRDPARLVGQRIATFGIPSMGAALLNGIFPKPSKQPIPVEVNDAEAGFALLRAGKAVAAILPTPLVRQEIARGGALRVLLSTEPIPHMGLSAAPGLDPDLRRVLRDALLNAHKSDAGRAMLSTLGLERFDPANATVYRGQANILQTYWGF